jgi:hypothetical protein
MDFHVSHASHRFGLFFWVLNEFFVLFFVPADGGKTRDFLGSSVDPGHVGEGNRED